MGAVLGVSALGPTTGGFVATSYGMGGALTGALIWPIALAVTIPSTITEAAMGGDEAPRVSPPTWITRCAARF